MNRIVVAIGGSSGSLYAKILLDKLVQVQDQLDAVGIVMSDNAKYNWELEIGNKQYEEYPFKLYHKSDFMAPFASGSAKYNVMFVCPCSMGLLARMANGVSDDLITRAADVMLKERRKLIIVPRETPYNLIHLRNMTSLTEAGAIICPASPSFYSKPESVEALVSTVVDRMLDLAGIDLPNTYRWGS